MPVLRTFHIAALCAIFALSVLWPRGTAAQAQLDSARIVRAQSPDQAGFSQTGNRYSGIPYDGMPRPPVQPVPVSRPVSWPGTPVDSYAAVQNSYPTTPYPSTSTTLSTQVAQGPPSAGVTTTSYAAGPQPTTPLFQPPAVGAAPMVQSNNAAPAAPTIPLGPAPAMQAFPAAGQVPAQAPVMQLPATQAPAPQFAPQTAPPQFASTQPLPPQFVTQAAPQQFAPAQALPPVQGPPPQYVPQAAAPQFTPAQSPPPQAGFIQSPQATDLRGPVPILPSAPQELTEANIVARIGSQVVLASDVRAMISDMLAQRNIQIPKEQEEEAFRQAQRQVLKQIVETKLIYNDAVHTIPAEGLTNIEAKVNEVFDTTQLPELLKTNGVTTRQELDAKLRARGSSFDRARRSFFERTLSTQWVRNMIKIDEELPHADVLSYYQQHAADYEFPAKARWEELMVRFDRFPDKGIAHAELGAMGNDVMRGAPLDAVARARSQGGTASQGGVYDWTTKGSLAAKNLDEAVFSLPVGSLSQIIETPQGLHIVRVIERKEAGRTPFTDVQPEIKKKLKEERAKAEVDKYIAGLRKRTPVWTIYDDQPGGLEGPAEKE